MSRKIMAVLAIALLIVGAVVIFSMAEPAAEPGAQPSAQPDAQPSPGAQPSAQPGAAGAVYYLNFKPEQAQQWEALAQVYTRQTGVPVTVLTAASGTYETTLTSEIEKADAPTLFQVNGPVGLRKWKDYCLDLKQTQLYQSLKSPEFALEEDGKALAIAYVIETYGLIYNRTLLQKYCGMDGAVISQPEDINSFDTLKAVAEDIQARRGELGVKGAFTSAGMDASSDWRFKTHLANLPLYYEYRDEGVSGTEAIKGTYLDNYKAVWDLYLNNSTTDPGLFGAMPGEDAVAEVTLGEAVLYQNGTWAYADLTAGGLTDDDLGMLPIYIGAPGEEEQGLCTGSENYWCVNQKAKPENVQATVAFLEWVITSDEGRDAMANQMGFVTPFTTFDEGYTAHNALLDAAEQSIADGKTQVSWNFPTMPSENWKNMVGAALLEYAQGTAGWDAVETAFVDGWASEYKMLGGQGGA